MANDCYSFLTECAIGVKRSDFVFLSEEAKLQVTDEVLTGMLKFITDKYNALDFGEIERSAGDINKFKYAAMIEENVETLTTIYRSTDDKGAEKYVTVCNSIRAVIGHLRSRSPQYKTLYQSGNGVIQLLYTSLVAGCLYATGTLVSNTIRFVTTEQGTDCQVLYDEIPGSIKHVHLKNIIAAAEDLDTFDRLLDMYGKGSNQKVLKEEVTLAGVVAVTAGVWLGFHIIPMIISLIREIIYSIYFNRVKMAEMLQVQVDLLNTNIESLEAGRGNKTVIARQKKIVSKLEKWKNKVAVRMDSVNSLTTIQKNKENATLRVDRNSPIVQDPGAFRPSDIML